MYSPQALIRGLVQRIRPMPSLDSPDAERVARLGAFGDMKVESAWPTKHLLADEGCYFTVNPPIGAAIPFAAAGAMQSFSATAGLFAIFNNDKLVGAGGTGKSIYMDFIKIIQGGGATAATMPAATVAVEWAAVLDTGNRAPTANSTKVTPNNVNGNSSNGSIAQFYYCGANSGLTIPSVVNATTVDRGIWAGAGSLMVAFDELVLNFGAVDFNGLPSIAAVRASTANAGRFVDNAAPFIIGPQQWGLIYMWGPASITNAWTYEFAEGHVEK